MGTLVMDELEYVASSEDNLGYCTACNEITSECVEPDAEGYLCPECEEYTVIGLDNALILGHIDIE